MLKGRLFERKLYLLLTARNWPWHMDSEKLTSCPDAAAKWIYNIQVYID